MLQSLRIGRLWLSLLRPVPSVAGFAEFLVDYKMKDNAIFGRFDADSHWARRPVKAHHQSVKALKSKSRKNGGNDFEAPVSVGVCGIHASTLVYTKISLPAQGRNDF